MGNALGHVALMCALARAGIASVSVEASQFEQLDQMVLDAVIADKALPDLAVRVLVADERWFAGGADLLPGARPSIAPDQISRLLLSSGTTGKPKIIALTHRAMLERLETYALRVSTPDWHRLVCTLGISTNYGYSFAITTLWLGRTIIFAPDTAARQAIASHQADLLVASTHQLACMAQYQEERFIALRSLRAVHMGGSVAYTPLLTRLRLLICNNIICGYGSTEAGTVAFCPADLIHGMDRAVGIKTPWVDLQVVDAAGALVEPGQAGALRIRALGQGNRYRKTAVDRFAVDGSEWFDPGDQGIVYRNGLLMITGRTNEIINRGGIKMAPDAIEDLLRRNPLVDDVAVVGVLDPIGIEQIWAGIVARQQADIDVPTFYQWCRQTMPHCVPDRIFPVMTIPRTSLGKVAREALKQQLEALEKVETGV